MLDNLGRGDSRGRYSYAGVIVLDLLAESNRVGIKEFLAMIP